MHSKANRDPYPLLSPALINETYSCLNLNNLNKIIFQINFVHHCVKMKNPLPLWIPCAFPHSVDIYAFVSTINENIFVLPCLSDAVAKSHYKRIIISATCPLKQNKTPLWDSNSSVISHHPMSVPSICSNMTFAHPSSETPVGRWCSR